MTSAALIPGQCWEFQASVSQFLSLHILMIYSLFLLHWLFSSTPLYSLLYLAEQSWLPFLSQVLFKPSRFQLGGYLPNLDGGCIHLLQAMLVI
jgi:hypothetical protein